jgi:hypothetical protein
LSKVSGEPRAGWLGGAGRCWEDEGLGSVGSVAPGWPRGTRVLGRDVGICRSRERRCHFSLCGRHISIRNLGRPCGPCFHSALVLLWSCLSVVTSFSSSCSRAEVWSVREGQVPGSHASSSPRPPPGPSPQLSPGGVHQVPLGVIPFPLGLWGVTGLLWDALPLGVAVPLQ